ncbi:MAG TPA: hypothetical protein VL123_04170 [Candidatus Udaeobacter sp.]|nr:hypothetical protein [Candidatus Udaeobacter sp.]
MIPKIATGALLTLMGWFWTGSAAIAQSSSSTPADSAKSAETTATTAPPPVTTVNPTTPDFPRGKISGYIFGDVYYNVTGDPAHHYSAAGADSDKVNIDNSTAKQIGKDLNGAQIRRVYFQLDNDLSIKYATRLRLEIDSKSLTSDGKIGINVKAAYALARSVVPRGDFYFGMVPTPIWDNEEEFWQYRSIEKTQLDFRGIGTTVDLGAQLKGFLDPDHHLGYWGMIGDGTGQVPESNRQKKFYLSLPLRAGDLRLEPYADYEHVFGSQDRATYKVFAGYELKRTAIGFSAFDRVNHRPVGGNQEPVGFSIFARSSAGDALAGFARFDLFKPDRRAADRVDSQLWIAGIDWQPLKDVHFMPNVEATEYHAIGAAVAPPHHELQARLTVYFRFSRPQS